MRLIKKLILHLLDKFGYVLLKKTEYATLNSSLQSAVSDPLWRESRSKEINFHKLLDAPPTKRLQLFLEHIRRCKGATKTEIAVLCSEYLSRCGISGDIVDCGNGSPEMLCLVARQLKQLGDTTRSLVLIDVTGDPTHRPETELKPWGMQFDPLGDSRKSPDLPKRDACSLVHELISTGYPADKIVILHYPAAKIALNEPIAFLALTSEAYDANRTAICKLMPLVTAGGLIGVEDTHSPMQLRDAVQECVESQGTLISLQRLAGSYRLGVKANASHG